MHDVIEALKIVLADTSALYLKTQNYHWNVTGPNFHSLHSMFETQYTDMATAIDVIAERIRALGEKAPGTWKTYSNLTTIKDGDENKSSQDMVKELSLDQSKILTTLNHAMQKAQDAQDEATMDMITARIVIHEKAMWMLNSSI